MKSRLLAGYKECEPLFTLALLGDSQFTGMTEEDVSQVYETFITEIVNSHTGYDPGFKNKSFFVTLQSVPFVILATYLFFMLGSLLVSILLVFKIFKRQSKIRHWIGLIIFLPIFLVMIYLFIGALNGSAFNSFVNVIRPISNFVPIGNPEFYVNAAIKNTRDLLSEGPEWLVGTYASGRGTNPVLDNANKDVMFFDYILLFVLGLFLIWFIWFLFKRNKVIKTRGFTYGL